MMNDYGPRDYSPVLARLTTLSLLVILGVGIAAIGAGYTILQSDVYPAKENTLIRNILFLVGLMDLAMVQFLKRKLLSDISLSPSDNEQNLQVLMPVTLVITALCSAISIYGVVAVFLGSSLEVLLLFVAVSLIGYQLFRIRAKDLERDIRPPRDYHQT